MISLHLIGVTSFCFQSNHIVILKQVDGTVSQIDIVFTFIGVTIYHFKLQKMYH